MSRAEYLKLIFNVKEGTAIKPLNQFEKGGIIVVEIYFRSENDFGVQFIFYAVRYIKFKLILGLIHRILV